MKRPIDELTGKPELTSDDLKPRLLKELALKIRLCRLSEFQPATGRRPEIVTIKPVMIYQQELFALPAKATDPDPYPIPVKFLNCFIQGLVFNAL